jgi:hypothetical protein
MVQFCAGASLTPYPSPPRPGALPPPPRSEPFSLLDSQLEFRTNRIRENLGGEQRVVSRFNHKRLKHRFNRIILRGDAQLQIQDQPRFDMLLIGKLEHYPKSEERQKPFRLALEGKTLLTGTLR